MKFPRQSLFAAATLLASVATTHGQQVKRGADPEHREVHRSLSAIEAEMRSLIDQNENGWTVLTANAEELRKANRELIKADRQEQQKWETQVHQLEHEARLQTLAIELNRSKIQRLQLEMDSLNRYDAHIIEEGDDRDRPGFRNSGAPQIRSITVLKEERGAPTRVTGVGFGSYTTKLYEITFTDGSKQRVESKDFTPTQRR